MMTSKLRQGVAFNTTKFLNPYEMTLSFPTAMGLPFVYTIETPTLLSVNAYVKAKTQPELVANNVIRAPKSMNLTSEFEVILSTKTQAKLGFVTPFNHKHYIAGYDKKAQLYLPIEMDMDVDLENNQLRLEVQPLEKDENNQVFHFSSWPYTATRDILQMTPVSRLPTAHVVHIRQPYHYRQVFGEKSPGMVFQFDYYGCHNFLDLQWLHQHYQSHEGLTWLIAPLTEDSILHYNLSLNYDASRTTAETIVLNFGWNQTWISKHADKPGNFEDIFNHKSFGSDYNKRQEHFLNKSTAGINSVVATVLDLSVQFQGEKQFSSYNATLAFAKSHVDKKSKVLFYFNKDGNQEKQYEMCLIGDSEVPNTNGLDYEYAEKFDPTALYYWQVKYGDRCSSGGKAILKAKVSKSKERMEWLRKRPMAEVCRQEMKEGNRQLEGCRNMTTRANFYDHYEVEVNYNNVSPLVRNVTNKLYNAARYFGYYYMDEDVLEGHGKDHRFQVEARFAPDFKNLSISLHTEKSKTTFNKIRVGDWVRPIVAVHPVFDVFDRINGFAQETYFRRKLFSLEVIRGNYFWFYSNLCC